MHLYCPAERPTCYYDQRTSFCRAMPSAISELVALDINDLRHRIPTNDGKGLLHCPVSTGKSSSSISYQHVVRCY